MTGLLQDLRFAARMFARNRGFSAAAIVTLALGVGANSAIFSVVQAALLRPLPFEDPARLVIAWERNPAQGYEQNPPAAANAADWKRSSRLLEGMALFDPYRRFNLAAEGRPERVPGAAVSADLFPLLGVRPAIGRGLLRSDEKESPEVVVLGHDLWSSRFHADPGILGRTILLEGRPFQVVGIMPEGVRFPGDAGAPEGWDGPAPPDARLWVPLSLTPRQWAERSSHSLWALARLTKGVTLSAASAELSAIQKKIEREHPTEYVGSDVKLIPLSRQSAASVRRALWILSGGVAFVLLIGCANIANLLLARAAARRREMAIRAALGASRRRVLRQLLVESLLLALVGGVLGILIASWGVEMLRSALPADFPRAAGIRVDGGVLAFTLSVAVAAGLLFGIAPALQLSGSARAQALGGGRTVSVGPRGRRARSLLVVGQFAVAFILVIGAALMARSLLLLTGVQPGFDPERVLTLELSLPATPYATRSDRAEFFRRLLSRVETMPGVRAAGITTHLPLAGQNENYAVTVVGRETPRGEFPSADVRAVSPGYFSALAIPLRRGRLLSDRDRAGSPPVLVINEKTARRFFPGRDPLGQRLRLGVNNFEGEIIGVVADFRHVTLAQPPREEVYALYDQAPFWQTVRVAVRTGGEPMALAPAITAEVRAIDRNQPIAEVRSMEGVRRASMAQPRFRTALLALFGTLAVLLAAIGIYGLLAYNVSQRRREIGLRIALGAAPGDVFRLFVREGMALACGGVLLGLLGAFGLTRVLSSLLFAVSPTDPPTYAAITFLLVLIAAAASYLPARRAARLDPAAVLRSE